MTLPPGTSTRSAAPLKQLSALTGLVLSACLFAGCSTDDADSQVLTYDEYVAEYQKESKAFPYPLPDGQRFPSEPDYQGPQDMSFQRGAGKSAVVQDYLCIEASEALTYLPTDEARAHAALDRMQDVAYSDYASGYLEDPDRGMEADLIAPARLGDPEPLREFMTNSCGKDTFPDSVRAPQ